jgi:hypothetical protein
MMEIKLTGGTGAGNPPQVAGGTGAGNPPHWEKKYALKDDGKKQPKVCPHCGEEIVEENEEVA